MKTPEEIKKGLEICGGYDCRGCPYYGTKCDKGLNNDALAYIQQLEQRLVEVNKTSPRWISIKEREPEPFTNVLGYIPNNYPFPPGAGVLPSVRRRCRFLLFPGIGGL